MNRKEIRRVEMSLPNLVSACEDTRTESLVRKKMTGPLADEWKSSKKDKKEEALINSASADSVRTEKMDFSVLTLSEEERVKRYMAGGQYYD